MVSSSPKDQENEATRCSPSKAFWPPPEVRSDLPVPSPTLRGLGSWRRRLWRVARAVCQSERWSRRRSLLEGLECERRSHQWGSLDRRRGEHQGRWSPGREYLCQDRQPLRREQGFWSRSGSSREASIGWRRRLRRCHCLARPETSDDVTPLWSQEFQPFE